MKAVIVSGGNEPSKDILIKIVNESDIIIGADRGCEVLWKNKIIPNIIVGDFDSVDKEIYSKYRGQSKEFTYNPEKDYTDTDIAFNKAVEMEVDSITLLGCTGTRMDHTLANIGLLKKAMDKKVYCEIIDNNNKMFLINGETVFKGKKGETISFLAYFQKVENLNIIGSKYPLYNYNLEIGDSLTVSNEFLEEEMKVTFDNGILLVNLSKD